MKTGYRVFGFGTSETSTFAIDYYHDKPPALLAVFLNGRWMVHYDMYISHKVGPAASRDFKDGRDLTAELSMAPGSGHGTYSP